MMQPLAPRLILFWLCIKDKRSPANPDTKYNIPLTYSTLTKEIYVDLSQKLYDTKIKLLSMYN